MFFWRVTWTQPGLSFESEYNGFYEITERLIHLLPIPDPSHSVPWLCIQESEHSKLKQTKQNLKSMFLIVYISNISFVWWDHTQTDFLTKKKKKICFYLSSWQCINTFSFLHISSLFSEPNHYISYLFFLIIFKGKIFNLKKSNN